MIKAGIKTKRVSQLMDIPVSSIYYFSKKAHEENRLFFLIQKIAYKFPFFGYRRIHKTLKSMNIHVNHKRVYRIYKLLNLQRQKYKRNTTKKISPAEPLTVPKFKNHVWAIDFTFSSLENGKPFKCLVIEDIYSRFVISVNPDFSITAQKVTFILESCFKKYGIPKIIRTDQGPEFKSSIFQKFLAKYRVKHEFIPKASPWKNGYLESFNGKCKDECINMHIFKNLKHAKKVIQNYLNFYNTKRPHMGLNYKTPYSVYYNNDPKPLSKKWEIYA